MDTGTGTGPQLRWEEVEGDGRLRRGHDEGAIAGRGMLG